MFYRFNILRIQILVPGCKNSLNIKLSDINEVLSFTIDLILCLTSLDSQHNIKSNNFWILHKKKDTRQADTYPGSVSPRSPGAGWSRAGPSRRWAHRAQSGWRSSRGCAAGCGWWRWCRHTAPGSSHTWYCSSSQVHLSRQVKISTYFRNIFK